MSSSITAVIINGILCKFAKAGNLGQNKKHFLCDSKKAFCAKESAVNKALVIDHLILLFCKE